MFVCTQQNLFYATLLNDELHTRTQYSLSHRAPLILAHHAYRIHPCVSHAQDAPQLMVLTFGS